ncbi:MAG: cytidine deaminase [Acidimicrobiia bacterium]|nr:cytidine deaminase [Acidimicrobiia bacterium]
MSGGHPSPLVNRAREAALAAYAPYSEFRVGAVVVTSDGEEVIGVNVENAAYPSSTCAEASAIANAVAMGARKIDTIVVACIDAPDVEAAYPCGRCRQIMSEFDVKNVVVTGGRGTRTRTHTLDELLPHRFNL